MSFLGAIAAMTQNRVIGLNGTLPWHYPADLRHFKRRTMGCTVIMGRLTWESIHCRALPGRRNIVISRAPLDHVECYTSIEKALSATQEQRTWIIGGGQIYHAAFDHLTLLDITYVPDTVCEMDAVLFPVIAPEIWVEKKRSVLDDSSLINVVYMKPT